MKNDERRKRLVWSVENDLDAGTSVVVHGQRLSRTLTLVVAASDTCHTSKHAPKNHKPSITNHNSKLAPFFTPI